MAARSAWLVISMFTVLLSCNSNVLGSPTDGPNSSQDREVPFQLTRVTRTETAEKYTLSLEYEAESKPTVLLRCAGQVRLTRPEEQHEGRVEVEVLKSWLQPDSYHSTYAFVTLSFFHGRFAYIAIKLSSTRSAMDFPRVQMHLDQGRDVTYRSGTKVQLDFDLIANLEEQQRDREVDFQLRVMIPSSEGGVDSVTTLNAMGSSLELPESAPVRLEILSQGQTNYVRYKSILINSTADFQGLLSAYMSVYMSCSDNCLVFYYAVEEVISVHKEGTPDPVPDNFLAFMQNPLNPSDSSDVLCQSGEDSCSVSCSAMGKDIESVSVSRVSPALTEGLPEPQVVQVPGRLLVTSGLDFPRVHTSHAGVYRCAATRGSQSITRLIYLSVITKPHIDKSQSYATKFQNNGTVVGVCTAQGTPLPTISWSSSTDISGVSSVSVSHPAQDVTVSTILISDPDTASYVQYLQCQAANVQENNPLFYRNLDVHVMYLS